MWMVTMETPNALCPLLFGSSSKQKKEHALVVMTTSLQWSGNSTLSTSVSKWLSFLTACFSKVNKITIIFYSDEGATTLNQTIVAIFFKDWRQKIKHSIWFMALHHRIIHWANEIQWHCIEYYQFILHSLNRKWKLELTVRHTRRKTDRHFPIFHSKTFSQNWIELNCMASGTLRHFPEFPNNFPFEKQMKFVWIIYQAFSGIEYLAIKVIKMSKTNAWIDIALGIRFWGIFARHKCYHKFSNILQLAKQINTKFLWTSESHQFWDSEYEFGHDIYQKRVEIGDGDSRMVEWILFSRWLGLFVQFQCCFTVVRFWIYRSTSPFIPSNIIIQAIHIHKTQNIENGH